MSALSKVADPPGWSQQERIQTGPNGVPYQSPIWPSRKHLLSFKLAVSHPQGSFSKPEPGDYLGCLLCKETSSLLCAPSEVRGCFPPSWPLSLPANLLSAGDHRGDRDTGSLAPAACCGTVTRLLWQKRSNKFNYPERASARCAVKGIVLEKLSLLL